MSAAKKVTLHKIQLVTPPQWEQAYKAWTAIPPPPLEFDNLIERLILCSEQLKALDDDYRKRLNEILSDLYKISLELIDNEDAWGRFRMDDAWAGKPPPANAKSNALKYVLRWACNRSRAGKQKASFYLRALKRFVENGTKPEDLPQKIKQAGGLKKAASAQVSVSKKSEKAISERQERASSSEKTVMDKDSGEDRKPSRPPEVFTLIELDLGKHLEQWAPMKVGTRFLLTGALIEMKHPAKIVIEKLEIL